MHDEVGTKIDGPHETRRRDRIVDEKGHGVPVCHTGDSPDIRNIETRVFYRLDICHLDARSCLLESGSEVVWSRALREADLDTEAVKQEEQFDRASIERRRCHDHIPCLDEGHEGCRKRTHARGIGHGRCSALELVHCTLEGGNGRIGNTRIHESKLPVGKDLSLLLCTRKRECAHLRYLRKRRPACIGRCPCWMQDPRREALLSGRSSGHSEAPRSAAASEALMRRT